MERRNLVLLGVFLGSVLGGSATAFSQVPESLPYIGNMSPQILQRTLEGMGFTEVTDMVRRGRIHYARATWEGEQVDMRINTASGAITDENAVVADATQGRPGSLVVPIQRAGANEAQVASALEGLGYTDVSVTKREGRIFNASATWDGNAYDLRINIETGKIRDTAFVPPSQLGSQGMPSRITSSFRGRHDTASVAQNLEAVGYRNVSVVRREGRIYRATAVWDNDIVDLRINAETGLLTQI